MGTENLPPEAKRPVREADNLPPSGTEIKMHGTILPLPHAPSQVENFLIISSFRYKLNKA
jgi:hypothetical protein